MFLLIFKLLVEMFKLCFQMYYEFSLNVQRFSFYAWRIFFFFFLILFYIKHAISISIIPRSYKHTACSKISFNKLSRELMWSKLKIFVQELSISICLFHQKYKRVQLQIQTEFSIRTLTIMKIQSDPLNCIRYSSIKLFAIKWLMHLSEVSN